MSIDYAPIEGCKHPEKTYGEICIQCDECGRFSNAKMRADIRIVIQRDEAIPPGWQYPQNWGGYFDNRENGGRKHCWYRNDEHIKSSATLEDVLPDCWYPERLPYLRWWIEGRNY